MIVIMSALWLNIHIWSDRSHCVFLVTLILVLKVLHLLGPKTEADLEKKSKVRVYYPQLFWA